MAVQIYNRISRKVIQGTHVPEVFGLFRLVNCGQNALQNNIIVNGGDFLIPDRRGEWLIQEHGRPPLAQGAIDKQQIPEDADRILAMGETLLNLAGRGCDYNGWSQASPLMPKITEEMELRPLDKAILSHLPHLREVCHRPREQLHVEIGRVWLSQARRLPHSAPNYLAAHTEDWERRTVRAVFPKRILSTTRFLDVDIYENRVTARLIDYLIDYLNHRIGTLHAILGMFDELEMNQDEKGWHFKSRRLYSLWGSDFDASNGRHKVESTLQKLESCKHQLLGLMDSKLYKGVPRRAQIDPSLKTTNVLVNDQHYRHVAQLWFDWSRWAPKRDMTPEERYQQTQRLCEAFDAFCILLIFRALKQFGFEPVSPAQKIEKGAIAEFESVLEGKVSLLWRDDGVISVKGPSAPELRFIPILCGLTQIGESNALNSAMHTIMEAASEHSDVVQIVLYPFSVKDAGKIPAISRYIMDSLPHELTSPLGQQLGLLPVSPALLGSVERIARTLRFVLTGHRLGSYPPKLDGRVPERIKYLQEDRDRGRPKAVLQQNGYVLVLRALSDQEHGEINSIRTSPRTSPAEKREIDAFLQKLMPAAEEIRNLLTCPVIECGTQLSLRQGFIMLEPGYFRCECPSCKMTWGKTPRSGGAGFDVFMAPHAESSQNPVESAKEFGADFTAKFMPPNSSRREDWNPGATLDSTGRPFGFRSHAGTRRRAFVSQIIRQEHETTPGRRAASESPSSLRQIESASAKDNKGPQTPIKPPEQKGASDWAEGLLAELGRHTSRVPLSPGTKLQHAVGQSEKGRMHPNGNNIAARQGSPPAAANQPVSPLPVAVMIKGMTIMKMARTLKVSEATLLETASQQLGLQVKATDALDDAVAVQLASGVGFKLRLGNNIPAQQGSPSAAANQPVSPIPVAVMIKGVTIMKMARTLKVSEATLLETASQQLGLQVEATDALEDAVAVQLASGVGFKLRLV